MNTDDKGEGLSEEEDLTEDEETGLTEFDQRKRRRTKRKFILLDERFIGDVGTAKQERKIADLSVLKNSAINALLIGSWLVILLSCGYLA